MRMPRPAGGITVASSPRRAGGCTSFSFCSSHSESRASELVSGPGIRARCARAGAFIALIAFASFTALTAPPRPTKVSGLAFGQREPRLNAPSADPSSENFPIREFHLMSRSDGWVLIGDRVLLSHDGGASWAAASPKLLPGQAIDTVNFRDLDHGWMVLRSGTIGQLDSVSVATTDDGGKSWSATTLPASAYVLQGYAGAALSFPDISHGWVLVGKMSSSASSRADLFSTSDGGKTWAELPVPPANGQFEFLTESTGWILGGPLQDELYHTTDAGHTWTRQTIALPDQVRPYVEGNSLTRPVYQGLHFKTAESGTIALRVHVTAQSEDLLEYSTHDGGSSWELQSRRPDLKGIGLLIPTDSTYVEADSSKGILTLHRGSLQTTASLPTGLPGSLALRRAEFVDAQHGWLLMEGCVERGCASTYSVLLGTEDGGTSLTALLKSGQTERPGASRKEPLSWVPQSDHVAHPMIGGVTGSDSWGLDTCQTVPASYWNSLYGNYGLEIQNEANYYQSLGFYVGGVTAVGASCYLPNSTFINQTACAGWVYLPIWDGYQAPCAGLSYPLHCSAQPGACSQSDLSWDAQAGVGDADSAAADLTGIGLSVSVAYLDMEQYPTGNTGCSQAVQTYVSAWVGEMHNKGFYAGVYGSGYNVGADMVPGVITNVPDDIWIANWNGNTGINPLAGVPNNDWTATQRIHQYYGGTGTYPAQKLIVNKPYTWDLDSVYSSVAVLLNPPPSCDEGCTAACYNGTQAWCGSLCTNCIQCTCVNGKCTSCPLILDPYGQGFHLTDLANGVNFALKAGEPVRMSWTDPRYNDAWLVLDRNGNGTIDNSTELFGDLTPQPDSPSPNGFKALAVFDDPINGGNGNGKIDPGDAIWSSLRLWIDRNHDGISQPDELLSLPEAGVFWIDLHYADVGYTDRFGNVFHFVSQVSDQYGQLDPRCYDVYLLVEPIPTGSN
jgi:hypothetical protein